MINEKKERKKKNQLTGMRFLSTSLKFDITMTVRHSFEMASSPQQLHVHFNQTVMVSAKTFVRVFCSKTSCKKCQLPL
jgi:NADH:ubiquinone oxidoreductase subunit F (NADH-binding)